MYLDREELEQASGAEGHGRAKNVEDSGMKYSYVNFASATAAHDAVFTGLTTTNGDLSAQLRQQ